MPHTQIETLLTQQGFTEYCWMNPKEIVVAQWVRMKCTFGCPDYGLGACPPNTPSVEDCRAFFNEYSHGLIIKMRKEIGPDNDFKQTEWSELMTTRLLELERMVFRKGFVKAFLLNHTCCNSCKKCSRNRIDCHDKRRAKPSPEAMAVDVFQTVKNAGMQINEISDHMTEISRFAFLLVE